MVWKDPAGADSRAAQQADERVLRAGREGRARGRAHADPHVEGRDDRDHDPAADRPWLGGQEGTGRAADRRRRGQRRQRPRDQARGRPDLPGSGLVQPRGSRVPRRRDRPVDRVWLAGCGRPAAGDRARRPRHLLRGPDRPARQRRRRPRLDHGGLGPDRDRGRDRLRAPRSHPVPRRPERRQGSPRRRDRGGHDRRAQRDHRRRHRGRGRPRPLPDRASATCTAWRSPPRWRCSWSWSPRSRSCPRCSPTWDRGSTGCESQCSAEA